MAVSLVFCHKHLNPISVCIWFTDGKAHVQKRILLEREARSELEQLIADGDTPQKIAKRARIILMSADGDGVMAIAREVDVRATTKSILAKHRRAKNALVSAKVGPK